MHVFQETGMSISEPCMFFRKQACPFRNHACFSRNRHVYFGTMRVFPETGMSISEPCMFFQKHACLFRNHTCFSRNMRGPQKTCLIVKTHAASSANDDTN